MDSSVHKWPRVTVICSVFVALRRRLVLAVVAGMAVLVGSLALAGASASADPLGAITEFSAGITPGSGLGAITTGPDGNLWFTEEFGNGPGIGRITPAGVVTEFSTITPESVPQGITTGPDGNLWFTESKGNRIGRITPAGVVTEFSKGITEGSAPGWITAGPDGNLWFTESNGPGIGRITPAGEVTEFSKGITEGSRPSGIAAGPDGNLWFTENEGNRIGRITQAGVVTEFTKGITEGSGPYMIVAGSDGNLWFTEGAGRIGRITPAGEVTQFSEGITAGSSPFGIAARPDGNLWFTEFNGNRIGRITPAGTVTEFSAGITPESFPNKIAAGPDGNLWFTEYFGNRIGRIGAVALPKSLLTVADTGAGKGTVSSEPAGIKCESVVPLSKCTEELEEKTKVKLTATPAGGSKFVKWSGGPCEGSEAPTCEFEMPGKATTVKAEFAELPTVWLCKPGLANNPCESDLTTTVQLPNGSSFVKHSKPASNPPIDCFYLYPQVSSQNTLNANLEIEPEQTQIAIDQASRFSRVCKVYSPMYPQLTVKGGLEGITPGEATIAYDGALAAWRYYLANYNHGRGVVLIGHSLGATALKQLIKEQIDPNPALRHRLVSADLLGGQVTVPVGKDVGGDFQHVPACHAAWQTGCVVAYSSFLKEPPEPSNLGRVASPYFKTEPNPSLQILCVNPAALFGGDQSGRSEGDESGGSQGDHSMRLHGDQSGLLLPYFSTSQFPGTLGPYWQMPKAPTPWVSTPGQYSAQCKQANGASWLQLTALPSHGIFPDEVQKLTVVEVTHGGDPRLQIAETLGPLWGTHLVDVNIALGNLVGLTAVQAWAYQAHRHDDHSGHKWEG
jgi:streptogramin lyase